MKKAKAEKLMRQFPLSTKGVENIGYTQGGGSLGKAGKCFFLTQIAQPQYNL